MQMAFDYDLDRPLFINPTHQFSRQGLDNPDAIYFNAYLREGVEYVVRGRRGTTRRPVVPGDGRRLHRRLGGHLADGVRRPRARRTTPDGTFEFTYVAEPGAKTMIVREVFNDWDTEERGTLTIERPDTVGKPAKALTRDDAREEVRGRRPVAHRVDPDLVRLPPVLPVQGAGQHPDRAAVDAGRARVAAVVDRPLRARRGRGDGRHGARVRPTAPTRAIQIGSDWYASTDYETHQTSLTKAQAVTDPDGVMRFVVSERRTAQAIANWLETTGHRTGAMMLRWQRLERDLGPGGRADRRGRPARRRTEHLPHFAPITPRSTPRGSPPGSARSPDG